MHAPNYLLIHNFSQKVKLDLCNLSKKMYAVTSKTIHDYNMSTSLERENYES